MRYLTDEDRAVLETVRREKHRASKRLEDTRNEIRRLQATLEDDIYNAAELAVYRAVERGLPLSRIAAAYGTTDARTIKAVAKRVKDNPQRYDSDSLAGQLAHLEREVQAALNQSTEPGVRVLDLVSVSDDKFRDHTYEFEVRNLTMKDGEKIGSKILGFTPVTGTALKNPLDTPEEFEVKEKVARALTNNPEYVTLVRRAISTSPYAATDPLMEGWTDDDATE